MRTNRRQKTRSSSSAGTIGIFRCLVRVAQAKRSRRQTPTAPRRRAGSRSHATVAKPMSPRLLPGLQYSPQSNFTVPCSVGQPPCSPTWPYWMAKWSAVLWFKSFSTWLGTHGIYLEGLYVQPAARETHRACVKPAHQVENPRSALHGMRVSPIQYGSVVCREGAVLIRRYHSRLAPNGCRTPVSVQ